MSKLGMKPFTKYDIKYNQKTNSLTVNGLIITQPDSVYVDDINLSALDNSNLRKQHSFKLRSDIKVGLNKHKNDINN